MLSHKEVSTCNGWDVMRVVDNSLFMKYFEEGKDRFKMIQKSKKISKTTHQLLLKEYYKLDYEEKQKFDNDLQKKF